MIKWDGNLTAQPEQKKNTPVGATAGQIPPVLATADQACSAVAAANHYPPLTHVLFNIFINFILIH